MNTLIRLLLIAPLLLCANCGSLAFYTQAIRGQAEISFCRKKITTLLADPTLEPALAKRLALSQEILDFAEQELSLDSSGSYRHYTDLGREHVVHIVYAAPEFSLEAKSWWYPIVGSQDYRGYFKKEDAQRQVSSLQEEGLDTFLGGVNAYSTLGFFKDPLLNTFIDYPQVDFAELIFHELTHHQYYEKEETSFNEALAEVVAREGTRRWLQAQGDQKALAQYELRLRRRSQIRSLIEKAISQLEMLYASNLTAPNMRNEKERQLTELREKILILYRGWRQQPNHFLSTPLNNARLIAFTTYEALIPGLQEELRRRNGDIAQLLIDVKKEGPEILQP